MTDPIDPIRPADTDRRQKARRRNDPSPAPTAAAPAPARAPPAASDEAKPALEAHLLGQENQRRGLRGGPETLAKARAAYLNAEWSGPTDRRTRTGVISKTEV